jgi:hypothetical protein
MLLVDDENVACVQFIPCRYACIAAKRWSRFGGTAELVVIAAAAARWQATVVDDAEQREKEQTINAVPH